MLFTPVVLALAPTLPAAVEASADAPERASDKERPPPPFHYNLKVELPITAAMTLAWGMIAIFGDDLAPRSCNWCDPNSFDTAFRDALRWDEHQVAGNISDGICYAGMPLLTIGWEAIATHRQGGGWRDFGLDMAIIGETAATVLLFGELLRYSVARERPDVHALPADQKLSHMPEAFTSMASGHMSFMLALTISQGIVFGRRGYPDTPYVWATGLTLSALTAYLRLASDRHYMTDVLAGSAIGIGVGIAIPLLHRNGRPLGPGGSTIVPVVSPTFAGAALRWQQ